MVTISKQLKLHQLGKIISFGDNTLDKTNTIIVDRDGHVYQGNPAINIKQVST